MKKSYLLNCFALLIPIFIWNVIFIDALPDYYLNEAWNDIPMPLVYTENILKMIVFILPLIMTLSLKTKTQKIGLAIYITGIIVYFLSWSAHIYFPESLWSKSLPGFMAPAYTTMIWFLGIGLIGQDSFLKIQHISLLYIVISTCFVIIHTMHPYIVFQKL